MLTKNQIEEWYSDLERAAARYKVALHNILKDRKKDFYRNLYLKLQDEFGLKLNVGMIDSPLICVGSTVGWNDCLKEVCEEFDCGRWFESYEKLGWDESDMTDDTLINELPKLKIVLPDEFYYGNADDGKAGSENEEEDEYVGDIIYCDIKNGYVEHCPKNCDVFSESGTGRPECDEDTADIDWDEIFQKQLGLTEQEYFKCAECGDYFYITDKSDGTLCRTCRNKNE